MSDKDAAGAEASAGPRKPPQAVIDEVLDYLQITEARKRASVGRMLSAHAIAYSASSFFEAQWPTHHQTRSEMEKAAAALAYVLELTPRLHPEVRAALPAAYKERAAQEGGCPEFGQLLAGMKLLHSLTEGLSKWRPPKRAPRRMLKNSVGGLMLILEDLTGNRAKVQRRAEGREPDLVSVEARVIGKLLTSVDPALQTTTLVNVISEICSVHRGKKLEAYEHQRFIGGKVTPHPAAKS